VVRQGSAKASFVGSIPTLASILIRFNAIGLGKSRVEFFTQFFTFFDRSRRKCLCAETNLALLAHVKATMPSTLKIISDAMKQTFGLVRHS
jgi:hypothetical protein